MQALLANRRANCSVEPIFLIRRVKVLMMKFLKIVNCHIYFHIGLFAHGLPETTQLASLKRASPVVDGILGDLHPSLIRETVRRIPKLEQ